MRAMNVIVMGLSALWIVGGGIGCAPQERVDDLRNANRTLQSRNVALEQELEACRSDSQRTQAQLNAAQNAGRSADQSQESLLAQIHGLQQDNDDLLRQIDSFVMPDFLPVELNEALMNLADRNAGLMVFDPLRGMVQMSSDLTFDLGSDQVRADATATLQQLAGVLSDSQAGAFEVRIVGHTDNVPIGKPATRAKHPTNMHLSVHRAISVRNVLLKAGVNPGRIAVSGYGEFRPIVPNQVGKGSLENRRVEIYLVPMSPDQMMSAEAAVVETPGGAVRAVPVDNPPTDGPMK